ncbi:MAG: SDR family oxidoreductase [Agarilytica sp.]
MQSTGKKFSGKTLLVVGGASGIGSDACVQAAQEGANIIFADNGNPQKTLDRLKKFDVSIEFVATDVVKEAEVKNLFIRIKQKFGRLDAIINAAGVAGLLQSLLDYDIEDFRHVLDVNLLGTVACCKHGAALIEASGGGRICNISSIAGETGFPLNPAYAASKAAVISITKSLAADLAIRNTPVQVNSLCPGWTDTPFLDGMKSNPERMQGILDSVPNGRLGESWEVAHAALWMAMEAPWYLNGETIRVDGGLLSSSPTHIPMMREYLQKSASSASPSA